MKRILLILVLFCTTIVFAQEKTFESEVKRISKKIDRITKKQKDSLKQKVKEINLKLEKKEITQEEATKLKKEAAKYHANKIEELVSVQELKLQQLVQDKTNGKIASEEDYVDEGSFSIAGKRFRLRLEDDNRWERRQSRRKERWKRKGKRSKSTTTQFIFAMGVNNVLVNDEVSSLNNSNYKFWQSHFYEIGWTWKTRFGRDASQLYFKYGASFLWNNLRPKNNQYHVVNGDKTELQQHSVSLIENRLRHVQMIFPFHIEWDLSRNGTYADGHPRDRTNKSIRMGLGAFFGFKLGSRQYLEYHNAQGVKVQELQKGDFNMNTLNYGLSAFFAYRGCGVYAKYDLNPLFKGTDVRNLSLGIRFDIN